MTAKQFTGKWTRAVRKNIPEAAQARSDSLHWLIAALDPNHDAYVPLAQYPGDDMLPSFVIKEKASLSISTPQTAAQTAPWSAYMWTPPFVLCSGYTSEEINKSYYPGRYSNMTNSVTTTTTSGGSCGFGPLTIWTCLDGVSIAPVSPAYDNSGDDKANMVLPLPGDTTVYWTNTQARLISQAFEVANTSSALSKGGTLVCFRHPQNVELSHLSLVDTVTSAKIDGLVKIHKKGEDDSDDEKKPVSVVPYTGFSSDAIIVSPPPSSFETASKLTTSIGMPASEGCYIVNHMQNVQNDYEAADQRVVLFANDSASAISSSVPNSWVSIHDYAGVIGRPMTEMRQYFDCTGAYFKGLPAAATLQVYITRIIEVSPGPNSGYRLLQNPAPSYDVQALMSYINIARSLPVACPFAENGFGDWWRKVVAIASKVTKALSPFSKPLMGALDVASMATGMPISSAVRNVYRGGESIGDAISAMVNR